MPRNPVCGTAHEAEVEVVGLVVERTCDGAVLAKFTQLPADMVTHLRVASVLTQRLTAAAAVVRYLARHAERDVAFLLQALQFVMGPVLMRPCEKFDPVHHVVVRGSLDRTQILRTILVAMMAEQRAVFHKGVMVLLAC